MDTDLQADVQGTGAVLPRRRFVQGAAALTMGLAAASGKAGAQGPAVLRGNRFDLTIGPTPVNITGYPRTATTVNGTIPAPILRWKEGETVTLNVTNRLSELTSIHWHGILLPNGMDGVPGLTFRGIRPGETFTYQFPVKQSGTYWYHSHSGMQEQTGLYGPLILEPRTPEPFRWDREYVVMLSDWTDENLHRIVSKLKQQNDYYNFFQRTLSTFAEDVKQKGFAATMEDRLMWGTMRMSPSDIMDVTGATYTFLMNGQPPAANWTALFEAGQRVRLRFINAAAMTTFDVRIPGLALTIVQADGTNVAPVEVEEFRIGVAETYDVIVMPRQGAYTIFAQAQDRSGFARGTLAVQPGLSAAIPTMDPRPLRTMADMGMAMSDMSHNNMSGMGGGGTKSAGNHGDMNQTMPGMSHGIGSGMDRSGAKPTGRQGGTGHNMPDGSHGMQGQPQAMQGMSFGSGTTMQDRATASIPISNADNVDAQSLKGKYSVDNVATEPKNRLAEAGDGLDGNGRRVLTYADLRALHSTTNGGPPTRALEFRLTGNMQRWLWGFNGKKFSQAGPVLVRLGERIRFILTNDTMMEHPIHLHGFLFSIENGQGDRLPLKHTINVKPGERMGFVFTADMPGHWAFHCHLLYHMEVGMFRTILVT